MLNIFSLCFGLTSVTIPNSVTCIGDDVFGYCTTLERVIIGANVTTIGSKAFYETALNQIVLLNDKPATLGNACFNSDNTTPLQPLIVVPYGTKNDYKSADGWKEFEYIIDGQTCAKIYTYIHATITNGETYSDYGFNESGAGTYTQTLQTADGCDSIITLYLQVTSSIDGVKQAEIITIYPNPASASRTGNSMVTIEGKGAVIITNSLGQVVKEIKDNNTYRTLNIKDFERGMYYIKVGNTTQKLVVE